MLPEFGYYLEMATQLSSANVRIVSNFSFQCDDNLKLIADVNCYVGASIDSADSEVLAKIRSGANLSLIKNNLKKLVNYYVEKWGTAERVFIYCTVQKHSVSGLQFMTDIALDCGINTILLSSVTSELPAEYSLDGISSEVASALSELAHRAKNRGVSLYATSQLGELPLNQQDIPACIRPWSFATISFSGEIGFCDHLIGPLTNEFSVGDYNNNKFEDIWNCQNWQELRREHFGHRDFSLRCSRKCQDCYKKRYIDFEHLLFPKASERRVPVS